MSNAYTGQGPHSDAPPTNAIQPKICNYCEQIIKEDEYETKPIPGHDTCKLVLQCMGCKESVHAKCAGMNLMVLKAKDKTDPYWRRRWSCRICIWDRYQRDYNLTERQLLLLNDVTWNVLCKLGNIEQKLDFMGKYEEQLEINQKMNKKIQVLEEEITSMKTKIKPYSKSKNEEQMKNNENNPSLNIDLNKEIQSLKKEISFIKTEVKPCEQDIKCEKPIKSNQMANNKILTLKNGISTSKNIKIKSNKPKQNIKNEEPPKTNQEIISNAIIQTLENKIFPLMKIIEIKSNEPKQNSKNEEPLKINEEINNGGEIQILKNEISNTKNEIKPNELEPDKIYSKYEKKLTINDEIQALKSEISLVKIEIKHNENKQNEKNLNYEEKIKFIQEMNNQIQTLIKPKRNENDLKIDQLKISQDMNNEIQALKREFSFLKIDIKSNDPKQDEKNSKYEGEQQINPKINDTKQNPTYEELLIINREMNKKIEVLKKALHDRF